MKRRKSRRDLPQVKGIYRLTAGSGLAPVWSRERGHPASRITASRSLTWRASLINLTTGQRDEVDRFLPNVGWRIVRASEFPSAIPESLRSKIHSALVFGQTTVTGRTYLIVNASRVDGSIGAIESQPLGLIVHATGPSSNAVVVHHGWPERPPAEFWEEVLKSGIVSKLLERTHAQLPKGHRGAVDEVIRQLRAREGNKTSSS